MLARITNANVRVMLESKHFLKDKDKNKYAILWASKFYRTINRIMRLIPIETQLTNYPYTIKFIKHFLDYFDKFGITKDELKTKNNMLYRGVTNDFVLSSEFYENGFMSTSLSYDIAKDFAKNNGFILKFPINLLPDDTKFVIINDKLRDDLLEDEILFLPGKITLKKIDNHIISEYKMNEELINKYKTQSGGATDNFTIPDILLKNKLIIWYRAIKNRDIELLG